MATSTDYDSPRGQLADLTDGLQELQVRRTGGQVPPIDVDDSATDDFELPGAEVADVPDGELMVAVVPMRPDEFRCASCFLVHHRSQRVQTRAGQDVCRDCA